MLTKRNCEIEFLDLKVQNSASESKIAKLKISLKEFNDRFEQVEERIRKIEDKVLLTVKKN